MKTISYKLGQESHVIVESGTEFNNSIFFEVYKKVESILEDYIILRPQNDNLDSPNNIVAFIGERGSGKTSCMMSMRKKIEIENKFLLLDLIDPSFFDEKVNILELVLANMFNKFKCFYESNNCNDTIDKTEIIKCFSKVKNNIDRIVGKEDEGFDELNELVVKASMVHLKENMKQLIQKLLKLHEEKSHLLITIDDLDLNTTHAYVMVEQIRKYLIQDNIIIFLSVKLDQLEVIIKSHYRNVFKDIRYVTDDEISEIADKYLSKLIPLNHRAYLPVIDLAGNDKINIRNNEQETTNADSNNYIKEVVLSLIFKSTRFLFYNSEWNCSPIIPTNLRELLNLIKMLVEMDTVKNKAKGKSADYKEKSTIEYNKAIFLNYFFQSWSPNNLEVEALNILEKLRANNNATQINKFVVQTLAKKYNDYLKNPSKELRYILDENCMDYNISLGDVMLVIKTLTNRVTNPKDILFFFAIKSYYSILLYKYYDEITEDKELEDPSLNRLYKQDTLHHIDSYRKLVGGSYINSIGNSIIPDRIDKTSRSCFKIDGILFKKLLMYILECKDQSRITFFDGSDKYEFSMHSAIVLTEFIALCIDTYQDHNIDNHRLQQEAYYDMNFSGRQQNIRFNLTSFFYNIIDYPKAIDRFGIEGLSSYIMENETSIYQGISKVFMDRYKMHIKSNEGKWKSWTCIRNIEILEDILGNIIEGIPRFKTAEIDLYGDFFLNIGTNNNNFLSTEIAERDRKEDYYIYTYDTEGKQHYQISFGYATVIGEKLKEMLKNESASSLDRESDISKLFNKIIRSEDKWNDNNKNSTNKKLQIKRLKTDPINKNETICKLIKEQYPNQFNDSELMNNYPDGERMSKKEAEEIINKISRSDG